MTVRRKVGSAAMVGAAAAAIALLGAWAFPQRAWSARNYKQTGSRSPYTHHIWLYDRQERRIDPSREDAAPFSPRQTCKKCHDYRRIARGYHFGPTAAPALDEPPRAGDDQPSGPRDRPGEPWIWTDRRTGTQLPISGHRWPGTYRPETIGLGEAEFFALFGRHACGRGPHEPSAAAAASAASAATAGGQPHQSPRWKVTGEPEIDCLLCHGADHQYSLAVRASEMAKENFAWAPAAAIGLAKITGAAKDLPDDFDPDDAEGKGVKTQYDTSRFDADGKVFFDVVRRPPNRACYACHTARPTGAQAGPRWLHDEDVHLRAGILCADCHRNGIEHHTVRGFEGETHPTGQPIEGFSCRGCHLGEAAGEQAAGEQAGRLGAPRPRHAGLPPSHLESISCTACHSGPRPADTAQTVQTSLAHALGIPSQSRTDDDPPAIVQPVFRKNGDGQLAPYRMMWPAFWGWMTDERIQPARPDALQKRLRRALRVRRDFQTELGKATLSAEERKELLGEDAWQGPPERWSAAQRRAVERAVRTKAAAAFRQKLVKALTALSAKPDVPNARAVYVSGGKAYRLNADGTDVETFDHAAARPYLWPLGHDVRPARQALGATGCAECHRGGAPIFYGRVTARGPAPDASPPTETMYALAGYDPQLLAAWEDAFRWRSVFKALGFVALGAVVLMLLRGLATWGRVGPAGPQGRGAAAGERSGPSPEKGSR